VLTFALLIVAGSLICLDRTQAFQVMLSRPVVLAPLLGLWAGELALGAAIGIAFEFLYAGRLPVGSNIPPCDTLAALGAAGILVLVPALDTPGEAGLAVAIALPLAEWGRVVDVWIRRVNGRIASRIDELVSEGDISYVEVGPLLSLAIAALAWGTSLLFFFTFSTLAIAVIGRLPGWLDAGLSLFLAGLPLLGLAESATTLDLRRFSLWAAAGLAVGLLVLAGVS
jgi:mannose/fructose/N-acetylgalactosamine-specific phosphotransferase system component IIC